MDRGFQEFKKLMCPIIMSLLRLNEGNWQHKSMTVIYHIFYGSYLVKKLSSHEKLQWVKRLHLSLDVHLFENMIVYDSLDLDCCTCLAPLGTLEIVES